MPDSETPAPQEDTATEASQQPEQQPQAAEPAPQAPQPQRQQYYAQPQQPMYQQPVQYAPRPAPELGTIFLYSGLSLVGLAVLLSILAMSLGWSAWLMLLPVFFGFSGMTLGILASKKGMTALLVVLISGGFVLGFTSLQTMISSLAANARYESALKKATSSSSSSKSSSSSSDYSW